MKKISIRQPLSLKEFEKFFRDNYYAASIVAFRYLNDPHIVEDIVQETFITLWEKREKIYRGPEELKHYLLVAIKNRTISYLRTIKIKQVELEASLLKIEQEEIVLDNKEEITFRISKAISKLPRKCKQVFLLAYIDELSYQDIAQKLSISKNTVKTQMVIAYRILRSELREAYLNLFFTFSRWIKA
ncbi:RNA polymerase sigma factor [Sunxiuqinia sp. A32]|uniref:RNA polymerase sigma factor n=1 Tax=Sunxiuqinia sp. A32 TaxID=3461496 RepID=UPI004045F141